MNKNYSLANTTIVCGSPADILPLIWLFYGGINVSLIVMVWALFQSWPSSHNADEMASCPVFLFVTGAGNIHFLVATQNV